MKKFLLTVLLFLSAVPFAFAGASDNLIAAYAYKAPAHVAENRQRLAEYLTRPYKDDYDKLKSLAYWIASHIAYDGYKYNNGEISEKEMRYEYDILKYRTGICGDFAELFADLAGAAGIHGVEYVQGYVLEGQVKLKRSYRRKDITGTGHAWNRVKTGKHVFYVDTTFMASGQIGGDRMRKFSSVKHRHDLRHRSRKNFINTEVNGFFFDFTPRQELKLYGMIHLSDKFIR